MSLHESSVRLISPVRLAAAVVLAVVCFQGATVIGRQCQAINPNDDEVDTEGLQCRLDQGGTIILETPIDIYEGGYIIDATLRVTQANTTLRSASPTQTARIKAAVYLNDHMFFATAPNVEIDRITFDGRKDLRTVPCNQGGNVILYYAHGAHMHDSESKNAYCGSALLLAGNNIRVINNYIAYAGYDRYSGRPGAPWADGITILTCQDHGEIAYNVIVDVTDVGIVSGGGKCWVHHNQIFNGGQSVYVGIHVHWFTDGDGIHSSALGRAVFEDNSISGADGFNRIGIGLLVGPHPWFGSGFAAYNAIVRNNQMHNSAVNLLVEGGYNVIIEGNDTSSPDPYGGHPGPLENCPIQPGVAYVVNPNHSSGSIPPGYIAAQLHNTEPPPDGPCFLF